jgi:acetyltransferase-like isoleucine patch superfamily enzyme
MKVFISRFLKPGSLCRWLASGIYRNPLRFPVALFRSAIATKKLTGNFYPIRVRIGIGQILKINNLSKIKATLIGNLLVNSWGGSSIASSISCAHGANFTILGDFEIGPNVHIQLGRGAKLLLAGKKNSSASGITCNTRIMVEDSLNIGADCIIAWDVFISDSNWHEISGVNRCCPVSIGDQVWISHGVSVLKGSVIPFGCIVGAKSLVANVFDTQKAFIAGVPAKVIKNGVEWSR